MHGHEGSTEVSGRSHGPTEDLFKLKLSHIHTYLPLSLTPDLKEAISGEGEAVESTADWSFS